MATRKICVDEVTTMTKSFSESITCTSPAHTPTSPGDEARVHLYNVGLDLEANPPNLSFSFDTQFEYHYDGNGATFSDYCTVTGQSGAVTLPEGISPCCDEAFPPEITSSATCSADSITTTPSSVSGEVSLAFTVTNLCAPTIISIEDTTST